MAGKADLVNGIVDRATEELQSIPEKDGWKIPESYAGDPFASTQSSGTEPDSGSVRVGTGGGGGGN